MNWLLFVFCAVQVILPSDRTTVYDSLMFPVDRVFVFSDKISELQSEELEQMAVEFQGSIGVILVDVWVLEIKLVTFCHVSCWFSTLSINNFKKDIISQVSHSCHLMHQEFSFKFWFLCHVVLVKLLFWDSEE